METTQESRSQTVSLCMIVKNEQDNLPRCLASAQSYVDEIIVVDTGSEDATPNIAAQYGAKVSYFEWCDDFAVARNYALSLATGTWILVLDADEELIVESEQVWQQIHFTPQAIAYSIPLFDADEPDTLTDLKAVRLLKNLPGLQYMGRYHEVPRYQDQEISQHHLSVLEGVKIKHYGYAKDKLYEKNINRSIPILERAWQEDGLSLTLLYTLAGMYNATQQVERAQECYAAALEQLTPNLLEGNPPEEFRFVPSLVFTLGSQALQQEDYETARLLAQRGIEWCPAYPPLSYLAGILVRALGFPLGAIAYFDQCLVLGHEETYYTGEPFEQSFITTYPAFELGKTYAVMGRLEDAIAALEMALDFDPGYTIAQEYLNHLNQQKT